MMEPDVIKIFNRLKAKYGPIYRLKFGKHFHWCKDDIFNVSCWNNFATFLTWQLW